LHELLSTPAKVPGINYPPIVAVQAAIAAAKYMAVRVADTIMLTKFLLMFCAPWREVRRLFEGVGSFPVDS